MPSARGGFQIYKSSALKRNPFFIRGAFCIPHDNYSHKVFIRRQKNLDLSSSDSDVGVQLDDSDEDKGCFKGEIFKLRPSLAVTMSHDYDMTDR